MMAAAARTSGTRLPSRSRLKCAVIASCCWRVAAAARAREAAWARAALVLLAVVAAVGFLGVVVAGLVVELAGLAAVCAEARPAPTVRTTQAVLNTAVTTR